MKNKETLEKVCDKVLNYLLPDCKKQMSVIQYSNAMDALKSIADWQAKQLFKDDAIQTLEKGLGLLLKKQQTMYSEEDMMKAVRFGELYKSENSKSLFEKKGTTPTEVLKKWFKQFKNK